MDDRARTAVSTAVGLAGAAAAVAAAAVAVSAGSGQAGARAADAVVVAACCGVGVVVLGARPRHRIGRLLLAGGAGWGLAGLALELLVAHLDRNPEQVGWVAAAVAAFTLRGLAFFLLVGVLPLVFPDGDLPSPRWRHPVRLLFWLFGTTFVVGGLFSTGNLDERLVGLPNPLVAPGWVGLLDVVALLSLLLLAATVVLGWVALAGRWRRGAARRRQQVGWLVLAVTLAACAGGVIAVGFDDAGIWAAAAVPIPVAVGVGVLQHRLYDVDLLVNRTLRYVLLSAAMVVIYVLVVAGVGALLGVGTSAERGGSAWIAAGGAAVVAVAFAPLHRALQRWVNRITYGAWDDPYAVLDRLAGRLAAGSRGALVDIVAELAASLALPHLAVVDDKGRTLAVAGEPSPADRSLPLVHGGVHVGALHVGPQSGRGTRTRQLLAGLAHQLAPAVAAAGLTTELQRSRERLVASREEERRRLRRDLHDGVGPALAALSLRLDTARNTVGLDPALDAVLLSLRHDVQDAVGDVRRVVEDLRPPALDELGLAGAVHRLADRFVAAGQAVEVVSGALPALPAAVEVAAYRIVQEALTNAVRHAGAARCRVELCAVPPTLTVRVTDDGSGGALAGNGSGLATMRERAGEVGGTFELTSGADGTVLVCALPLGGGPT